MPKAIPCFICGKGVELHDETAIAALCETHRTEENMEKLRNTPTYQLLRILNDCVKQELQTNKIETEIQIELLKEQIAKLEAQIKNQETIVQEIPTTSQENTARVVNEWGEVL